MKQIETYREHAALGNRRLSSVEVDPDSLHEASLLRKALGARVSRASAVAYEEPRGGGNINLEPITRTSQATHPCSCRATGPTERHVRHWDNGNRTRRAYRGLVGSPHYLRQPKSIRWILVIGIVSLFACLWAQIFITDIHQREIQLLNAQMAEKHLWWFGWRSE